MDLIGDVITTKVPHKKEKRQTNRSGTLRHILYTVLCRKVSETSVVGYLRFGAKEPFAPTPVLVPSDCFRLARQDARPRTQYAWLHE